MFRPLLVALASLLVATTSALAASSTSFPIVDGAGRPLGSVAIESTNLDRVSTSLAPDGQRAAVVVEHGRFGGATLHLVTRTGTRALLEVAAPDSLARAEWSPDGRRFAFVRAAESSWIDGTPPRLQEHGGLVLGSRDGGLAAAGDATDAARVLGWLGPEVVVFTRHLPGDLPEERPWSLELASGALRPLTDGRTAHAYGFALLDGSLYFSRTERAVVTAPQDEERVELVEGDPATGDERILAVEKGALASQLRRVPGGLAWRLDGRFVARSLELRTGRISTEPLERPAALRSPSPAGDLAMPYVHQVYDTPDDFAGDWACGPTSTLMCIQHHNRLGSWPITASSPSSHTSDYGAYVGYQYTAFGNTFDRVQNDAAGNPAKGGYGWCTEDGGAWAWRMQDYARKHDLSSDFDGTATFAKLQAAIDAGRTVALSTQLTSAGHIVAIKGYTSDGRLISNDPYGNRNLGYRNYQGENAVYTWAEIGAKWFITVYGTVTQLNAPPNGYLDGADCTRVGGWAQDPDEPARALDVHLYFGGAAGSGAPGVAVHAGDERSDLCAAIGSCNHGFSRLSPLSLFDGAAHEVHAYGIDSQGGANSELGSSPKSLQCPADPPAGLKRHVTNPEVLAAWKFDEFQDRMRITDAQLEALPTEKELPPGPALIRGDGAAEVYLVDQGFRRHVPSPEVAANWRLDLAAVQVRPLVEVEALPVAPPLRSRPVTVIGSGPALYLVDDALPVPALPDAGTPTADAGTPGTDAAVAGPDAGTVAPVEDAGSAVAPAVYEVEAGCGCRAAGGTAFGVLPILLAATLPRRRRR